MDKSAVAVRATACELHRFGEYRRDPGVEHSAFDHATVDTPRGV